MAVSDKVKEGAGRLQAAGRTLMFVTFTLRDLPAGSPETDAEMLDRLMEAWRRLRQGRWWRAHMQDKPWYRVVEAGTQHGRPHIHLVVGGRMPAVRAARDGESLASWRADLSGPAAREMVAALESAGLGPICHVERLRGGAAGAATYLGGYLSKSEKRLVRPDGRTVRVAEGSRDWPVDVQDKTTYMAGGVAVEPGAAPCECVQCGRERDAADVDKDWAAVRRRNVAWWWRWLNPAAPDVREDVDTYIRAADAYRAARAAVPSGRRHLVSGRIQAVPAGAYSVSNGAPTLETDGAAGSPAVWTPPLDVAEAVACRQAAYNALGRIRRRGYDGSVRLLRDMAAAGYDVEAVVA